MLHINIKCVLSELWYIRKIVCPDLPYTRKFDVLMQNDVTYDILFVRTYVTHENTKKWNVRTHVTHECNIYLFELMLHTKCTMSEHTLHTKIWCLVSELIIHSKICNVWTYFPHEYEICFIWTNLLSKTCNVRTYVTHGHEILSVWTYVTNKNVIYPNEPMLHRKI